MKVTSLAYSKEENGQAHLQSEAASAREAEQVLHLKRLLVSLKQHYEKGLQQVQIQLQFEQNQRIALQKELENTQLRLLETQGYHEEELQALHEQQITLKELLKKTQDALNQSCHQLDLEINCQQIEQSDHVCNQTEKNHLVTIECLREELHEAQKKVQVLEQELLENKKNAQQKIEHFQQLLEEQRQQESELETVISPTSSHHLRRELESIKRSLAQGTQETKALETRYIEILNEKIDLEYRCTQLQIQLKDQSSHLISFQEKLRETEKDKNALENCLQVREKEWTDNSQQQQELEKRVKDLSEIIKEKEHIQDKYEQLKEEWKQLIEDLEEAVEMRAQVEQHFTQLTAIAADQEIQLQDFAQQLQIFHQERGNLESERDQLKILLEESEARLKVSQQHLAKKLKETALLNETLEEKQVYLNEFAQTMEYQKTQIAQLQASVDLYQRQEERLQEQLHEALKGTESQMIKWEEKYFRLYEKWQESENQVKELKKIEEKYLQMQNLIANLGNFMGGAANSSNSFFHSNPDIVRHSLPSLSDEASLNESSSSFPSQSEPHEETYDLFGMKQAIDKYNPHLFS